MHDTIMDFCQGKHHLNILHTMKLKDLQTLEVVYKLRDRM